MRLLLLIIAGFAIALAGCGSDDEASTAEERPASEADALYERIRDLSDEEQIRRVGAAWAEPFSRGEKKMCAFLHPDIATGCSKFVLGGLTGSDRLQSSYADTRVDTISIDGKSATTTFSNGEKVDFQKDSDDEWKVVRTSRPG